LPKAELFGPRKRQEVGDVMVTMDRHRYASPEDAGETPFGIAVGLGTAGIVVAGLIAAMIPIGYPDWRFGVIAMAIAVFAALSTDQRALGVVAVVGALVFNGFLEDRLGQLAWHGSGDLWRLLLLIMAAAAGLAIGDGYRFVRDLRLRAPRVLPTEEEKHGA
jgi:hypothetical protein